MLENVRNRIALMLMSQEAKGVFLGTGIAFHGPSGTGKLIYSDGRENFDSPEVTRTTAFVVSAICYACIQWKADNIAEAPLRVARLLPDGSHEFVAHPLNQLLQEPSSDYDMAETLWLTVASLEVFARSLWVKDRNRIDQVGQLVPFNGREYTVEADNGRIYGKYNLTNTSKGPKSLTPEEVVAFKYLSPYDRYDGVSPTDAAIRWLNLGSTVETSVRRLLLNGMFPSVVISPDKDWKPDKDEFALFKQTITNYQTGPANAGKPLIALGGSKVARVAFSLRDLLPDEIMDRVEASAAMAYGIPPVVISALVGLKNSPWSQMKEARRAAYDDTLVPLWDRIARAVTRQLLRPVDSREDHVVLFDTSRITALADNQSAKIEDASSATWWTVDERRKHTGLEPLGGDRGAVVELLDIDGQSSETAKVDE